MPEGEIGKIVFDIDNRIVNTNITSKDRMRIAHLAPYILRAQALDHKLELCEIGRIFYHLNQRRGFKSNRKRDPKPDDKKEEKSKVKGNIKRIATEIEESGSRTLGEYFSKLNPEERRIRKNYTSRKMYEHEFNMIYE